MFLLVGLCVSATLKNKLIGEWRITSVDNPNELLYTIEFHKSSETKLISTLWKDNVPLSSRFSLSQTSLLAQLEFHFTQETSGRIVKDGKELCQFDMSKKWATAKINELEITVEEKQDEFSVKIGDELFVMKRAPIFDAPKASHSNEFDDDQPVSILERLGLEQYATFIYVGLAVACLQVIVTVIRAIFRCLCCPKKKPKKTKKKSDKKKKAKKAKKEDVTEEDKPEEAEKTEEGKCKEE